MEVAYGERKACGEWKRGKQAQCSEKILILSIQKNAHEYSMNSNKHGNERHFSDIVATGNGIDGYNTIVNGLVTGWLTSLLLTARHILPGSI